MDVDCYYQEFNPPNGVVYNSTLPNFTSLFITPTLTQKVSGSFDFCFRDFVNATVVRGLFNLYGKLHFTIKIYE